jgi:purine-nucleoside phosphorylase
VQYKGVGLIDITIYVVGLIGVSDIDDVGLIDIGYSGGCPVWSL